MCERERSMIYSFQTWPQDHRIQPYMTSLPSGTSLLSTCKKQRVWHSSHNYHQFTNLFV
uniref:Uncharacterized protein n=1 Tax=Rhizophora mucronata TaxID=61149 RepID=A0A2P2Q1I4_RHIMU